MTIHGKMAEMLTETGSFWSPEVNFLVPKVCRFNPKFPIWKLGQLASPGRQLEIGSQTESLPIWTKIAELMFKELTSGFGWNVEGEVKAPNFTATPAAIFNYKLMQGAKMCFEMFRLVPNLDLIRFLPHPDALPCSALKDTDGRP